MDVTERKRAEEELRASAESERLLLGELDHRVRNNLAALDSLINLGADSTTDVRQFAQSIGARVRAMATMHSLLSTSRWQPVRLQSLIEAMLIPGCHGRIELAGPAVEVPASQAQALGMVINELMTNSLKHGAFLSDNGTVRINWKEVREGGDQTRIALRWTESGGPPIETQPASGVGSALIIGLVKSELQGRAHLQYERRGANHRFEFTLADAMPWRSSISPADPIPPESG